jgi:hypothetical protein
MDLKLLEKIFQTPARTKKETQMASVIREVLKKYDIPHWTDKCGNIYNISKKNVPLLSAHMDTVQDEIDATLVKFIKIRGNILSGYGVIGGDDKCGIFIALTLACQNLCNFVFSVEEECGGNGIKHFMITQKLIDIPYGLVLDRKGYQDIICANNNYGTEEFEKTLLEIGRVFGYKQGIGCFSDANFLSEQISCANLSVGYYNPHSKSEFVDINDLKVAMDFTHAIIKNVKEKFEAPKSCFHNTYYGLGYRPILNKTRNIEIPAYTSAEYIGEICMFCNTEKVQTIFSKVCNDFICLDCMGQLRKEILTYEDLLTEDDNIEYSEMINREMDGNIDEILKNLEDEEQMPIGFDENFEEEEHHSKPTDVPTPSKHKEEICNEV